jgi:GT2 family glycosyltransferase
VKIAVAIPTYGREEVLLDTISQLLLQTRLPDEILVIDQTEEHFKKTSDQLKEWHKQGKIRWIFQFPPNLPLARNRAIDETIADVLIYIDDDVVLNRNFVKAHLSNYRDKDIHAVSGHVVQRKGWPKRPKRKRWDKILDYRYFALDGDIRVKGIANFCGANHSVRVDYLKAIGGYDKEFMGWAFREDTDAAIRLWKSGAKIVFDPKTSLLHLAAPMGGCRITKAIPEWMISYPATWFAIKHFFPGYIFWLDVFFLNVRKYVLRKQNIRRPWVFPYAIASYIYGVILGFWRRAQNV